MPESARERHTSTLSAEEHLTHEVSFSRNRKRTGLQLHFLVGAFGTLNEESGTIGCHLRPSTRVSDIKRRFFYYTEGSEARKMVFWASFECAMIFKFSPGLSSIS